jgi:hypothetical protein
MTKLESYLARCEAAVMPLTNGKKITVPVAVLQDHKVDAAQWRIDLHNAIAVDFYDPADCCLEGSSTPCYKVSVLVRQGQAIASAKEVFD